MSSKVTWVAVSVIVLASAGMIGLSFASDKYYLERVRSYSVPASSMKPALEVGDLLLSAQVFKAFGERYYPRRGDIILFSNAKLKSTYMKRLIGLPGERVQIKEGKVFINDKPLRTVPIEDAVSDDGSGDDRNSMKFREILPNGRSYEILDTVADSTVDNTNVYEVPEGHLFVLGDNRDNSLDSRVLSHMGYVSIEDVTGVVKHVYYSGSDEQFVWRSVEATQDQKY